MTRPDAVASPPGGDVNAGVRQRSLQNLHARDAAVMRCQAAENPSPGAHAGRLGGWINQHERTVAHLQQPQANHQGSPGGDFEHALHARWETPSSA